MSKMITNNFSWRLAENPNIFITKFVPRFGLIDQKNCTFATPSVKTGNSDVHFRV